MLTRVTPIALVMISLFLGGCGKHTIEAKFIPVGLLIFAIAIVSLSANYLSSWIQKQEWMIKLRQTLSPAIGAAAYALSIGGILFSLFNWSSSGLASLYFCAGLLATAAGITLLLWNKSEPGQAGRHFKSFWICVSFLGALIWLINFGPQLLHLP